MSRIFTSWIDSFIEYSSIIPSPEIFRKWSAISAISGALEQKVHIRALGMNLMPGTYITLVGPPGVGKTVMTSVIRRLWAELPDHHMSNVSVTKAALIDDLRDATRHVIRPGEQTFTFNTLKVPINELGVLIPSYENEFMNTLTDLWDCHPYSERRRSKDLQFTIERPQLIMLMGTTPSYLNQLLPEGAWDQGFLARTLLIFSGEVVMRDLFDEPKGNSEMWKCLVDDLKEIAKLFGKMSFSEEGAALASNLHKLGIPPKPEHPKLTTYLIRRTTHFLKLCMIASIDRSSDLIIEKEHVQQAYDWLIEAEHAMPDIFKAMSSGGDSKVIQDTFYWVRSEYIKTRKPVPEHKITLFIAERAPAYNVQRIIEVMVRGKLLKLVAVGGAGNAEYEPNVTVPQP